VQEIRVLAALQHPHILGLIDSGVLADHAGELRGRPYYVMPYVEGETLRRRLEREGPLPVPEAVRIATEVAGALAYAHRHGVIHRDIKPENILLHDGSALVPTSGSRSRWSRRWRPHDPDGMSLGTPQYMAPEQAMGEKTVDARADVYALGCVLYEMLTGEPPFTGPSAQAIVARVMTEQPVAPAARRATIPAHVEDAVLTAIEKLPADRFASAADFGTALADPLARPRRAHSCAGHGARCGIDWPVAILAGIALTMTAVAAWALLRPTASHVVAGGPVYETSIVLADSTPLAYVGSSPLGVGTPAFAVSPDGMTLVFVGQSGATTRLYQRRLDASAVAVLPGTDGAYGTVLLT
jgi:serine/threonine-protein kinase